MVGVVRDLPTFTTFSIQAVAHVKDSAAIVISLHVARALLTSLSCDATDLQRGPTPTTNCGTPGAGVIGACEVG